MADQDKKIAVGDQGGIELAPRYYLSNFQHLCTAVANQYDDILTSLEKSFLVDFACLTEPARCLYVRLISRRGPWFRDNRLAYAEIGALSDPIDELLAKGFLQQAQELCVEEIGKLYTREELQAFYGAELPVAAKPASKAALRDAIVELNWSDLGWC